MSTFNPVRFVAERTRANSTRTLGERLSDLYMGALMIVTLGAYAYGVALGIGGNLTVDSASLLTAPVLPDEARGFTPAGVAWVVLILASALVLAACARFGPASLSRAQSLWWLPLPVERGPLLVPSVRSFTLAAIGIIAPLGIIASGLSHGWQLPTILGAAGQGSFYAAALVGVATYLQGRGVTSRTFTRAGAITALIALVLATVLALTPTANADANVDAGANANAGAGAGANGTGTNMSTVTTWMMAILPPLWPVLNPFASPFTLIIAAFTTALCALIAVICFRKIRAFEDNQYAPHNSPSSIPSLGDLNYTSVGTHNSPSNGRGPRNLHFSAAGLTSRGGNRAQFFNAIYLLKFDELRSTYLDPDSRIRAKPRFTTPFRAGKAFGPAAAQTLAEITIYLRTPRILLTLLAIALIPLVVASMGPLGSTILVVIAAVATGIAMANVAVGPSTALGRSPALSALFPVSDRLVKVRSALVASIGVVPCYVLMWVPLTLAAGRNPLFLLVAAMAGIGVAAASVRLAVVPEVDLTRPMMPGPMGMRQPGLLRSIIHGNDAALIAQVPLVVGFLLGVVSVQLFLIQAIASAVALLLAARRPG